MAKPSVGARRGTATTTAPRCSVRTRNIAYDGVGTTARRTRRQERLGDDVEDLVRARPDEQLLGRHAVAARGGRHEPTVVGRRVLRQAALELAGREGRQRRRPAAPPPCSGRNGRSAPRERRSARRPARSSPPRVAGRGRGQRPSRPAWGSSRSPSTRRPCDSPSRRGSGSRPPRGGPLRPSASRDGRRRPRGSPPGPPGRSAGPGTNLPERLDAEGPGAARQPARGQDVVGARRVVAGALRRERPDEERAGVTGCGRPPPRRRDDDRQVLGGVRVDERDRARPIGREDEEPGRGEAPPEDLPPRRRRQLDDRSPPRRARRTPRRS